MKPRFPFLGGALFLDFVNTRVGDGPDALELLEAPEHLPHWLWEAKVIDDAERARLDVQLADTRVVDFAIELRTWLRAIVERMIDGTMPAADEIARVNTLLRRGSEHAEIDPATLQPVRRFMFETAEDVFVPVAASLRDFLGTANPRRLRRCDAEGCTILFYDQSKSGSRRWCCMTRCGNRAKVAAHYRRRKPAA